MSATNPNPFAGRDDVPNPLDYQQANRERPHTHYSFSTILQSEPASVQSSPYPLSDSYFDEAFRTTPSPPPGPSFFASILNPITNPASSGYTPQQQPSPPAAFGQSRVMPPVSRRNERATRNSIVDLTGTSPEEPAHPRGIKRGSPTPGPSGKRQKQNDGTAFRRTNETPEAKIDEIDISDDKQTVQEMLQKQRQEAVKAQQKPEEEPTTFKNFTCVICMDTPTDLTATACGHLFCHTCLMEALIAGENRAQPGEPKRSQCPVCRKFINRTKATDIIPLLLKKGLATQPRKLKSNVAPPKVTS